MVCFNLIIGLCFRLQSWHIYYLILLNYHYMHIEQYAMILYLYICTCDKVNTSSNDVRWCFYLWVIIPVINVLLCIFQLEIVMMMTKTPVSPVLTQWVSLWTLFSFLGQYNAYSYNYVYVNKIAYLSITYNNTKSYLSITYDNTKSYLYITYTNTKSYLSITYNNTKSYISITYNNTSVPC